MKKSKIFKNIFIALLLAVAIFIHKVVHQPYGIVAIGILLATITFNFIKNEKSANGLFSFGISTSTIILIIAFLFYNYAKSQRPIFTKAFPTKFEETNFETALAKAKKENKKVFIDFYASWCPPCLAFASNILTDTLVGENMNKAFVNVKYDAENGEGKIVAKKYNIKAYPALMVLDAEGNVLEVLADENVPSKEEMIGTAKKYLGK